MKARTSKVTETWTDADEAALQALIANDPDSREATEEEMAQARPFAEVFPHLVGEKPVDAPVK